MKDSTSPQLSHQRNSQTLYLTMRYLQSEMQVSVQIKLLHYIFLGLVKFTNGYPQERIRISRMGQLVGICFPLHD